MADEATIKEQIISIRNGIKSAADTGLRRTDATTLAWALQPIAGPVFDSLVDGSLDGDEVSLLVWVCYVGAVAKTKSADKFSSITSDDDAWTDMMVILRSYEEPPAATTALVWVSYYRHDGTFRVGSVFPGSGAWGARLRRRQISGSALSDCGLGIVWQAVAGRLATASIKA